MKTINLIIVSILLSLNVFSQETTARDIFVNLLAEECDGYVKNRKVDPDGSVMSIIALPEYYDFDLVRMSVASIVKEYSDVSMGVYWNEMIWDDGGISINCGIMIGDKMVIVGYVEKNKSVFVWDNN